jgi:hypothetical protein
VAARGQQYKMARIGALYIGTADEESFKKKLREGLRELGYVEGPNIAASASHGKSVELFYDMLPSYAASAYWATPQILCS